MLSPAEITQWLGLFEIVRLCDSSSIYNNSRQQAPVRVQVLPFPGQTLSDAEYASIGLVLENPDGSYEALKADDPTAEWFLTSHRDERFDPYLTVAYPELPESQIPPAPTDIESSLQPSPAAPDASVRFTDRYVHCQADGGSSIRLRGVITKDSGETFYTDSTVFDSSVTLYAQSPHSLQFPDDYFCSASPASLFNRAGALDEFTVAPRHTAFSFIALENQTPPQASGGTARSALIERNQRAPLAIAQAGDPALQIDGLAMSGFSTSGQLSARIAEERPGDIIISAKAAQAPLSGLPSQARSSCDQLVAYDRQGNQHRISPSDQSVSQQTSPTVPPFSVSSDAFIENVDISNIAFFQVKGLGSSTHAAPCDVYANLYQTTYVNVVIRAVDATGIPIQLTSSQLNSIVLVNYDTGQQLKDTQWYISSVRRDPDDLFDLYPTNNSNATPEVLQADQVITIWLKTKSLVNMEVAARIVLNGITYHTYQKDVASGGVTSSGRSNSSALIITHAQNYTIPPSGFKYTRRDYSNIGKDDIDLYTAHFDDTRYRICYSTYAESRNYWGANKDREFGWWNAQFTFRPGPRRVETVIVFGYPHYIEINTTPGSAYAARLIIRGREPGAEQDVGRLWSYQDQFGNSHGIYVRARRGTDGNMYEWVKAVEYSS